MEYGEKEIGLFPIRKELKLAKADLVFEQQARDSLPTAESQRYQKVILFLRKYSIPDTKVMMTAMYMTHWPSCSWASG